MKIRYFVTTILFTSAAGSTFLCTLVPAMNAVDVRHTVIYYGQGKHTGNRLGAWA